MFCVSRAGMGELEEISERPAVPAVCVEEGATVLFDRYRKRKVFWRLFFFLRSVFTSCLCSLADSDGGMPDTHGGGMLDYLEENGIKSGTRLSEISCHDLEEQIRRDYKDIAWVSCDLKGTLLSVTVKKPRQEAVQAETEDVPCHLIASRKGRIDSIVVRSGSAMVKKGDKVKRGDVLISGEVGLYDDGGVLTETALVKAEGDITAITKRKYEDSFPLLHYVKEYTGRSFPVYQLLLGEKLITLRAERKCIATMMRRRSRTFCTSARSFTCRQQSM